MYEYNVYEKSDPCQVSTLQTVKKASRLGKGKSITFFYSAVYPRKEINPPGNLFLHGPKVPK